MKYMTEAEAELQSYMDENDFMSALRTRPDKGAIYTNEIILRWIESTFKYAWKESAMQKMKNLRVYLEYSPIENDITRIWLDSETEPTQPGSKLIEHVISYKVPVEELKREIGFTELKDAWDESTSFSEFTKKLFPDWVHEIPDWCWTS